MTALAMKAHVLGFGIALLLFGPYFLVTGYLLFRSGYLPKPLGVLYQLAGLAYLFNGFVLVLAPQFAGRAFLIIAGPVFFGETSLAVWLLIKGVRIERWRSLTAPACRHDRVTMPAWHGNSPLGVFPTKSVNGSTR